MSTKNVYEVHIDANKMRHELAEIEQGNPVRMFKSTTLHGAIAIANAARFAAGLSMTNGPRSLQLNGKAWLHGIRASEEKLSVMILRRAAKREDVDHA